jgi:outer membrane protein assembly factor BamE (lipoprotein component of BamABCDE complex)
MKTMRPTRRWFRVGLVVLVVAVCVAVIGWALDAALLDGLSGLAFTMVASDTTEYSKQYSDEGFRRVRVGMTEEQVLRDVGPPLEKFDTKEGSSGWRYSRSCSDGNYRIRVVLFRDGRVVERIAEAYFD